MAIGPEIRYLEELMADAGPIQPGLPPQKLPGRDSPCALICELFTSPDSAPDFMRDAFEDYWRALEGEGEYYPPIPGSQQELIKMCGIVTRFWRMRRMRRNPKIVSSRERIANQDENGNQQVPNPPLTPIQEWEEDLLARWWGRGRPGLPLRPGEIVPQPGENPSQSECVLMFRAIFNGWIECIQDWGYWYERPPAGTWPGLPGPRPIEESWPPQQGPELPADRGPQSPLAPCKCCPNPELLPILLDPSLPSEDRDRVRRLGPRPA